MGNIVKAFMIFRTLAAWPASSGGDILQSAPAAAPPYQRKWRDASQSACIHRRLMQRILCTLYCALYCILYTMYCILYTMYCILYTQESNVACSGPSGVSESCDCGQCGILKYSPNNTVQYSTLLLKQHYYTA